ncbi:hypothetical protein BGZ80_003259 [Entomortierella chlamydospora]|uniref:Ataxin-10 homolog n=1 Tax=Entomortierella chlamydospora TaxID=101097 RepID=A0A9P6SWS4_9FUNG|nr:hypothetical protein BGZ80_003259 [Entomortierella chlamydospora]
MELGSHDDLWTSLALILNKVIKDGLDPEQVEQLMFLFRIIRNSAAGVSENQDRARDSNQLKLIQEIISQAAHTHYGNVTYIMMLRAGVQALSNLVTGNNVSKDQMWKSFLAEAPSPSCDQYLLSTLAAIEDETIVLSTVMLCYNCIFESRERSDLLFSTSAGKKLLTQLVNESHSSSGKEERKSFEMIFTFFDHLISRDYFPQLFEVLRNPGVESEEEYSIRYHGEGFHDKKTEQGKDDVDPLPKIRELKIEEIQDEEGDHSQKARMEGKKNEERQYLSAEHVVLLKIIDSRIYCHHDLQQKRHRERHSQIDARNSSSEDGPAISLATVRCLTEIFVRASVLTIEIFKTLEQPGIGQHGVEDLANMSSGLILLLGCFAHLSLYEDGFIAKEQILLEGDVESLETPGEPLPVPEWFKAQHMEMINGGLIESAIELLRQADKSLVRVTKPVAAMPNTATPAMAANTESTLVSNTSTEQGQQSFFFGVKRDIVRLVGNLAYRSRHVQDLIRQCNGLIVMLSQCNIDDANPYLREYAILAMKNILAGNIENQALIEELQPIEAVDHPALQEARVTAQLDAKTGRPVLTQKKT